MDKSETKTKLMFKRVAKFNQRSQLSSFVLFISVIIFVNLCPFHVQELERSGQFNELTMNDKMTATLNSLSHQYQEQGPYLASQIESCLRFVRLMFTNPIKLGQRTTRFTLAEAKMLGKIAKVMILKKKIKKFGKKLKKHTIAVPIFTAIPVYEHAYYPAPHVTHVTHGGHMHHAASSYAPVAAAAPQMATSASNTYQRAYRTMYPSSAASQIINAYPPSPPVYVDETGGLYGHYGNAYGRYDGGYHLW